MTDIFGLVEVSRGLDLAFYFVTIELEEQVLYLKDRTNGKKPLNMMIPLSEMEDFRTHTVFSTEEISFNYQDVSYKFVEYGNQTITLFGKLLERNMLALVN